MSGEGRVGPSTYFDPEDVDLLEPRAADLVRRRLEVLGPAYRLFYREPLEIVRGEGAHLFAADGTEYLDAYNNVPCVGHAHPQVTAAVAAQVAQLSTHTRYLHEGIVRYSEQLLATMPPELGHVMYTCTGSEAVDLALRIAKHRTGGTGVVVTRYAYHGVTTEAAAVSPSLGGLDSLAPWVRTVPAPDAVALGMLDAASLGAWFAGQVEAAIDDLEAAGIRFGCLLLDSVLASDGVLADPAGFLAPAREVVARRGGLYVADEVQPGFGRLGDAFWGFARHGSGASPFVPDLVVMGKPMGNGMPVAAVAMLPDVVAGFGRDVRYFNTFGGNPVSIAAAQTVLDVLVQEELQAHARVVGEHLRAGLRALAHEQPAIAEVRGAGLFIGVRLSAPGGDVEALTREVVDGLRRRRVLVGTAGQHNDVLKIRPPLVFSRADADRLLAELGATLVAVPSRGQR